jgi:UDP-2,4-diacetamido-2,4,6-trideoxy-beta-L-altropyranose hydrolase
MSNLTRGVLARADGSAKLGMGNVTRVLALARAAIARGHRVVFVGRDPDDRIRGHAEGAGCTFLPLPTSASAYEDVAFCRRVVTTEKLSGAFVDMSNTDAAHDLDAYAAYLRDLAAMSPLVIVDDLTRAVFPHAVVVNPSTDAMMSDYDTTAEPNFLIGPEYALLRDEYAGASARKQTRPGAPRKVVVALGGGVVAGELTRRVLAGVLDALGPTTELTLLAGFDDGKALTESGALAGFARAAIASNLPSICDLLLDADLAVVSGGVTKYEAAAAATPAITVATVPHQERWASTYADKGASYYAGGASDLTAEKVAAACRRLVDADVRRAMGARGADIVDGRGAERVLNESLPLLSGIHREKTVW